MVEIFELLSFLYTGTTTMVLMPIHARSASSYYAIQEPTFAPLSVFPIHNTLVTLSRIKKNLSAPRSMQFYAIVGVFTIE